MTTDLPMNRDELLEICQWMFGLYAPETSEYKAAKALKQLLTQGVDGYRIVPVEPTPEMIKALMTDNEIMNVKSTAGFVRGLMAYKTMLSAAEKAEHRPITASGMVGLNCIVCGTDWPCSAYTDSAAPQPAPDERHTLLEKMEQANKQDVP